MINMTLNPFWFPTNVQVKYIWTHSAWKCDDHLLNPMWLKKKILQLWPASTTVPWFNCELAAIHSREFEKFLKISYQWLQYPWVTSWRKELSQVSHQKSSLKSLTYKLVYLQNLSMLLQGCQNIRNFRGDSLFGGYNLHLWLEYG